MSFCCKWGCNDLADEKLQVLPPDGKTHILFCEKHAREWKLEALKDAAKDIKDNPPFGSEWNRRYGKRKSNS